jgi:hypothetical protein
MHNKFKKEGIHKRFKRKYVFFMYRRNLNKEIKSITFYNDTLNGIQNSSKMD